MRTYNAHVSQDGDFWLIRVLEIDRSTQARTADEIEYMARDLIQCMDPPHTDQFEVRIHYVDPKIAALREHYDGADLSDAIDRARWETDIESDPMVTTSLRLPKYVLDAVRACAQEDRVNVSVLLRNWIEEKLIEFEGEPHLTVTERVENLEARMKQTWELVVKVEEMVTTR